MVCVWAVLGVCVSVDSGRLRINSLRNGDKNEQGVAPYFYADIDAAGIRTGYGTVPRRCMSTAIMRF